MHLLLPKALDRSLRLLYQCSAADGREYTVMGGAALLGPKEVALQQLTFPEQVGSWVRTTITSHTWKDELHPSLTPAWVHTHPGGAAFWSAKDLGNLDALSPPTKGDGSLVWMVALVLGKGEWLARFMVWQPVWLYAEPLPIRPAPRDCPVFGGAWEYKELRRLIASRATPDPAWQDRWFR